MNVNGRLIVLSGPSGVGKTTVVDRLLQEVPGLVRSISATTRPRRAAERDGTDYFFLSPEEFERRRAAGAFLEWADVFDRRYGTPRAFVEGELSAGRSVILAIDVQGAAQVRRSFSPVLSIFLAPPGLEALRRRLDLRGADDPATIARRLAVASAEIARSAEYDHVVVNDDLDRAVADIRAILETGADAR